jgi:hypothetical protein
VLPFAAIALVNWENALISHQYPYLSIRDTKIRGVQGASMRRVVHLPRPLQVLYGNSGRASFSNDLKSRHIPPLSQRYSPAGEKKKMIGLHNCFSRQSFSRRYFSCRSR